MSNNKYMDVFDELDEIRYNYKTDRFSDNMPIPPSPSPEPALEPLPELERPPTPNSIQSILTYPKERLLISSFSDKQLYRQPNKKSYDARKIWRYAKVSHNATIREIEMKLLDWAFTYASLVIENNTIKSITWNIHSGDKCASSWSAFLKWIICASLSNN